LCIGRLHWKRSSMIGGEEQLPLKYILLGSLGWIAISFPRMLVSPVLPFIEADFNISHAQSALLMSSYLLPYAIVQLPAGSLSDRFGNRRFMLLAMAGTSLGSFLVGLSTTFELALAARFFAGSLSGFWFASSTKIIVQNTGSARQGRALGITYSGGAVASILIYLTVGSLSNLRIGWRPFFMVGALPGFVCLAMTHLFTRDLKEKTGKEEASEGVSLADIAKQLARPPVILISSFNFLVSLASWSLGTFVPTYLANGRGLSVADASSTMLVQATASVFNGLAAGYITDSLGFKPPAIVSMLVMCLVSILLPIIPLGMPAGLVLVLWGLVGGWSYTASNVFILKIIPRRLRGTFLGIFNQIGFISATIGPPIFGLILDAAGFRAFFYLALALYAASLVSILLIKERRS
jgi:MFS family permease